MGPITPISSRVQVPVEFQPKKDPAHPHKTLLDKTVEFTKERTFWSLLVNVIRQSLTLTNRVEPSPALSDGITWLSPIGSFFSVVSGFQGLITIIKNLKKENVKPEDKTLHQLETAEAAFKVIGAGTTTASVLDTLNVIQLADVTKGMGKIPVMGPVLEATLPASTVFSLFSMISNHIDITVSLIKISQTVKKIKRTTYKIEQEWKNPIEPSFAEFKQHRTVTKQETLVQQAEVLKGEIEGREPKLQRLIENYERKKETLNQIEKELQTANKIVQVFRSIVPKWNLKRAKDTLQKELASYNQLHAAYSDLSKTHVKLGEKGAKWEKIHQKLSEGTLTKEETDALEKMRAAKAEKWKSKKVEHFFTIVKEASSAVLSLISIAVAIVGIALALVYTGGAPAVAFIVMGAIGLTLSVIRFARMYYLRVRETPQFESVLIPEMHAN